MKFSPSFAQENRKKQKNVDHFLKNRKKGRKEIQNECTNRKL